MVVNTQENIMLTIFWDAKDDLFTDFLILRQTIIAAYYCLENMGFAQEDVNDQSTISSPLS